MLLVLPLCAGIAQDPILVSGAQAPSVRAGAAEASQIDDGTLRVHVYTLQHQNAGEAVEQVRPLLSARGTVELQPGSNTLVIRDTLAALGRIVPLLRSFDHPPRALQLELMLVQASKGQNVSTVRVAKVPEWLNRELTNLFAWDDYRILAETDFQSLEGEIVTYQLGGGYGVSFRLGTVVAGQRLKLYDVRIWRGRGESRKQLLRANLNPRLSRPTTLVLTPGQQSTNALMVVLICRWPDAPIDRKTASQSPPKTPGGP